MMKYDRDLKWTQYVIWVLLGINVGGAIVTAFRHEWLASATFLIWALNISVSLRANRNLQRTRDMTRVSDAAVLRILAGVDESGDQA